MINILLFRTRNLDDAMIVISKLSRIENKHIIILWFNENINYEMRIVMYKHDDTIDNVKL